MNQIVYVDIVLWFFHSTPSATLKKVLDFCILWQQEYLKLHINKIACIAMDHETLLQVMDLVQIMQARITQDMHETVPVPCQTLLM